MPVTGWARSLRRFARLTVWLLPSAAVCFALAGLGGGPRPRSAGAWLFPVLLGLYLALVAAIALTGLLAATTGRRWAVFSLLTMLAGTLLSTPALGVLAAGPPAATNPEHPVVEDAVRHWLGAAGGAGLGAGWFALGFAVIASHVLNRADGFLMLLATAVAGLAVVLSWPFLLVAASMLLLASGLGVAWGAARLDPDHGGPGAESSAWDTPDTSPIPTTSGWPTTGS